MASLVTAVTCLHALAPEHTLLARAGLWFIAAQGCLSYGLAGLTKLASPPWRRGEAVGLALSNRRFGFQAVALRAPRAAVLARLATWATILFEIAFPACLLLGSKGVLTVLALVLLFHVANATLLGLNSFVWAYAATYPSLLFASRALTGQ